MFAAPINPVFVALALSLAANGLLGWQWLGARDRATVAVTQRDDARADATACSDATDDLRTLADARKKEADKARAVAAGQVKTHDQRADYTLGLRPKNPADMCASMQALGDDWLQGRVQK